MELVGIKSILTPKMAQRKQMVTSGSTYPSESLETPHTDRSLFSPCHSYEYDTIENNEEANES